MNPVITTGAIRGLLVGVFMAGLAFFGTWQTTDTECHDTTVINAEGGDALVVHGECTGWKPVIVATGLAFFGSIGSLTGLGVLDSRDPIQVEADRKKRGDA